MRNNDILSLHQLNRLDEALLLHQLDERIDSSQLEYCPVNSLAVAYLRSHDLDSLIRDRAYSEIVKRMNSIGDRKAGQINQDEFLLVVDMDYTLDVDALSVAQLALAPFSPEATAELVSQCASVFFAKARARQSLTANDRSSRMNVELRQDSLIVYHGETLLYQFQVSDRCIERICMILADIEGETATFRLRIETNLPSIPPIITVELGRLSRSDTELKKMMKSMKRWKDSYGIPFETVASEAIASLPPIISRPRVPSLPPPSRPYPPPVLPPTSIPKAFPSLASDSVRRSRMWLHVSKEPKEDYLWDPRLYRRMSAFIHALDPTAHLDRPHSELHQFTEEEIALLAYAPNRSSLPDPRGSMGGKPISIAERAAIESLYSSHISLDRSQWIMEAGGAVAEYVRLVAKLHKYREAFIFTTDLWVSLSNKIGRRMRDGPTDPSDGNVRALLVTLSKPKLGDGMNYFLDRGERITESNKFNMGEIGVGAYQRYSSALDKLIRFEQGALARFK